MNQTRNLIFYIIINITTVIIIPFLMYLCQSDYGLIALYYVILLVTGTMLSFLKTSNDSLRSFGTESVYPPFGLLTIIFLFKNLLNGRAKKAKYDHFNYYMLYYKGHIYVYDFEEICST